MSFYVIVNSNQSLDFFPNNTPSYFCVHLKTPLQLQGIWKVGLSEIYIHENHIVSSHRHLYVYTNICGESIVDGESQPLLRRLISNENGSWMNIFQPVFYLTVNKTQIYDIEFYIKTDSNQLASFLSSPVTLTLHFKAYPFFN